MADCTVKAGSTDVVFCRQKGSTVRIVAFLLVFFGLSCGSKDAGAGGKMGVLLYCRILSLGQEESLDCVTMGNRNR